MKTIDITPTWSDLLPLLLELASKPAQRKTIHAEFAKMAQAADNWNQHCKELQEREELN